jgi:thymidylate synthase (FAD)
MQMDPLNDGISSIKLTEYAGSDLSVVNAARTSYKSHSEQIGPKDISLLELLIKEGHKTPFEMTFLQFLVKAPQFVVKQWMRHRIGVSYNEQSARYTKIELQFYIPKQLIVHDEQDEAATLKNEYLTQEYQKALSACSASYELLIDAGVRRELARCVLPFSFYTTFYFCCNLTSLFHFVELRADSHAQWEVQQYAKAMLQLARPHFPHSIDLWCKYYNVQLPQDSMTSIDRDSVSISSVG